MTALNEIRKTIVHMAHYSHASHVGAALSVVDILYVLYTKIARITKENVFSLDRDKVILSKGHASTALYSVLAYCGLLDKEKLERYYIDGGELPGHLDKEAVPGVDVSAGSLGHGLSLGVGMALAKPQYKVYVVLGDGECEEGSVWEAVQLAPALKVKNLVCIVDANGWQGFGKTQEISAGCLSDKFRAFGWDVAECNGHALLELEKTLKESAAGPKAIIAHTHKGNGVSFMQDQFIWHYKSPNDEQWVQVCAELDSPKGDAK